MTGLAVYLDAWILSASGDSGLNFRLAAKMALQTIVPVGQPDGVEVAVAAAMATGTRGDSLKIVVSRVGRTWGMAGYAVCAKRFAWFVDEIVHGACLRDDNLVLTGVAGLAGYICAAWPFACCDGIGHGDWVELGAGVGMTGEAIVFMDRINLLGNGGVAHGAGAVGLPMIVVRRCVMSKGVTGLAVCSRRFSCRKANQGPGCCAVAGLTSARAMDLI